MNSIIHKPQCSYNGHLDDSTLLYMHRHPQGAMTCQCFTAHVEAMEPDARKEFLGSGVTYKYFLTFTTAPNVSFDAVRENFQKFCSRAALELLRIWYVEEHLDTNPHIHVYVETSKQLSMSRLASYKKCGAINKQVARGSLVQIEDYMSKENELIKKMN